MPGVKNTINKVLHQAHTKVQSQFKSSKAAKNFGGRNVSVGKNDSPSATTNRNQSSNSRLSGLKSTASNLFQKLHHSSGRSAQLDQKLEVHQNKILTEKGQLQENASTLSTVENAKDLNSSIWNPIENNNAEHNFRDTTTPVNQHFDTHFDKYGQTGLCSITQKATATEGKSNIAPGDSEFETGRVTNFWKTEISDTSDKENLNGKTKLFSAWRSGCMAGKYLGKTDSTSKEVALTNAKEFLTAIAIDKLKGNSDLDGPIKLTSINLMDRGSSKLSKAESKSIKLQEQVLKEVAKDGIMVNEKLVKFEVNTFSIPTNITGLCGRLTSRKEDNEAIRDLCAAAWKDGNPEAKLLSAEITKLMKTKSISGKIGYEFPALVSNLAFQMGHEVAFNCKSGKDRTGMMDISSKFVALRVRDRIESGDTTRPTWDLKTKAGKNLYQETVLSNASFEITKKNTGATGLKIQGWCQKIPKSMRTMLKGNSSYAAT